MHTNDTTINILVADDETATRHMITQYLKKKGYTVFEAADGFEAFTAIIDQTINIAIIDWMMPGMNGLELCRKIRDYQKGPYIFIIMLTAKTKNNELIEGFEAGVDEYVHKPLNLQELMARIHVGARIVGLERKLLEKQRELTNNNQMKNKFIGIVAHDLRNPLISIRGFSELLIKDSQNFTSEQNEFLDIIHTTSRNMLAMINDLLDISRIESGNMLLDLQPGALKVMILERIQIVSLQAAKKHITIHKDLSTIPEIVFDHHRMGQAVDNLVTNAIKFSPSGSNVYIKLKKVKSNVHFDVTDEGPGIPQEEQHLLFSEFHRLSVRPTGGETSTGLGLTIAKKIIEAHNGKIEFESREGRGSTFRLILPLVAEPAQSLFENPV
ncbi:MAG: response regulator [Desulfobacteraceae bacterium]|nr:response regulator [Desulfobacteraceae bacterium]